MAVGRRGRSRRGGGHFSGERGGLREAKEETAGRGQGADGYLVLGILVEARVRACISSPFFVRLRRHRADG